MELDETKAEAARSAPTGLYEIRLIVKNDSKNLLSGSINNYCRKLKSGVK